MAFDGVIIEGGDGERDERGSHDSEQGLNLHGPALEARPHEPRLDVQLP